MINKYAELFWNNNGPCLPPTTEISLVWTFLAKVYEW
jgi:hypothetical protein